MVKGGPREAEEVGKDGQTERWRRGETMKKPAESRKTGGEQVNSMAAGFIGDGGNVRQRAWRVQGHDRLYCMSSFAKTIGKI